jgi:hypothetical protein
MLSQFRRRGRHCVGCPFEDSPHLLRKRDRHVWPISTSLRRSSQLRNPQREGHAVAGDTRLVACQTGKFSRPLTSPYTMLKFLR